jgi:hypothetical protein
MYISGDGPKKSGKRQIDPNRQYSIRIDVYAASMVYISLYQLLILLLLGEDESLNER